MSDVEMGLIQKVSQFGGLIKVHQLNSGVVSDLPNQLFSMGQIRKSRVIDINQEDIHVNNQDLFARHVMVMSQKDINSFSQKLIDQGFKFFFELMHAYYPKDQWPSDLGEQIKFNQVDLKVHIFQEVNRFIQEYPHSPLLSWMRCELGLLLIYGDGCQKDFDRGLNMVKAEAENSNSRAMCFLGRSQLEGIQEIGIQQDVQQAVSYLCAAAAKNYVSAVDELALVYSGNYVECGIPADEKKQELYTIQSRHLGGEVGEFWHAKERYKQNVMLLIVIDILFLLGVHSVRLLLGENFK